MWSPGPEECIPMENTSFGSFSAGLHHKNLPAAAGGILIAGGLAAIVAGLVPAGFCYLALFAGKSAGYYASLKPDRPTSVHCCGM